ncbi:MAG: DHH family phosphoesterase, partial [Anaerolineales bacterium]
MNEAIGAIKERLDRSKNVVVASHVRPDGDAIGSLLGLGLALRDSGKSVQMVLVDGVSTSFRHLEGSELILKEPTGEHDTFVTVDCADFKRVGKVFENFGQPDINIDHHITNENFGKINFVLPEYPATCAILAKSLPDWGYPLDLDSSSALLMGILTDTIGFRTANVTPATLRQAALLMESGAALSDIYTQSLVSQSFPASLIWGSALSRLVRENGLVWTVITLED